MSPALKSGRWKSCGWRWNELFSPAPFPAAARHGKRDFLCSGMMVSCANSTMDPLRFRRSPGGIPRRISPKSGLEGVAVNYAAENGITSGVVLGGDTRVSDASVREIFNLDTDAVIPAK